MELIKDFIIKQVAEGKLTQDEAKIMLKELKGKQSKIESDIAIIGMACRVPGANNTEEYWNILMNEECSIGDVSKDRKEDYIKVILNPIFRRTIVDGEISEDDLLEGKLQFERAGYLDEVDKFDAAFFHIPPREAKFIDPIQRISMETIWEAIEDAGYGGDRIYGSNTGVYFGRDCNSGSLYKLVTEKDQLHLTGSWTGLLATRISYIFNLKGPGMVIDTACSAGATSIHQACQALRNKECDTAIAGGVSLFPKLGIIGEGSAMAMVESQDSKVKTFDRNANGTVWGEGVGVLILKPLSKAIADGDNIHAVIKGSAVNNDGASNGITAPNAEAQEEVIVDAWKDAKVNPETISYIEAHATGTVLGDPIEIKGIENAFFRFTGKKQFCGIGSAKPSIGHLVAASGLASVIKVVLALKKGIIPATLNFEEPNPYINFEESPVYVNDTTRQWDSGEIPRRAGVSSFGFSGTNCHIILEEAPKIEGKNIGTQKDPEVLTISARNENVLLKFIDKYVDFFKKESKFELKDICYTSNTGRGHYAFRIAIIAENLEELRNKILMIKEKGLNYCHENGVFYGQHKVAPANKKNLEAFEITEAEKVKITLEAKAIIGGIAENSSLNMNSLRELCSLYVQGAEFNWDELYKGQNPRKVQIPVYPLERIRFWAEPKELDLSFIKSEKDDKKAIHPLFENEGIESIDRYTYITKFNVKKHWVLNEHRIAGNCVVPGTTYLEMAREASKCFYPDGNIVLKDFVFINPLVVNEDEDREAQTIIKQQDGFIDFTVSSKSVEGNWIKHVEGNITSVNQDKPNKKLDINEIRNRCLNKYILEISNNEKSFMYFGPRWNDGNEVYVGKDEMLGYFELNPEYSGDLEFYGLHPALMDNAVNMANSGIGEGLYLPLVYKVLKIYGRTPEKLFSYLRRRTQEQKNPESVSFDVTLMDENGVVFAEVEDYTIKRVNNAVSKFRELSGKSSLYHEFTWIEEALETTSNTPSGKNILVFRNTDEASKRLAGKFKENGAKVTEVETGNIYLKSSDGNYIIRGTEEDYNRLIMDVGIDSISSIIHMINVQCKDEFEDMKDLESSKQTGIFSLYFLTRSLSDNKVNNPLELILISESSTEVTGEEECIYPCNNAFLSMGKVIGAELTNIKCKLLDIDRNTSADDIYKEILSDSKTYLTAYRKGKRYVEKFQVLHLDEKADSQCQVTDGGVYLITGGMGGIGLEIGKYLASKGKVNLCMVNRSIFPEREKWDELLLSNEDLRLSNRIKLIKEIEDKGSKVICYSADVSNYESMKCLIQKIKDSFGTINGIVHAAGVAGNGLIINRRKEIFNSVIKPKVDGAWILDSLTGNLQLDFFVLFSSVQSFLGGAGQGDYTAANSYIDSFTYCRNKKGRSTKTINWPSWKETGMAVEYGVNKDSVFKAISTLDAIEAFDKVLSKDVKRIIIAEPNFEHEVFQNESALPFYISSEISNALKRFMMKKQNGTAVNDNKKIIDVKLKGRSDGNYTEMENSIGQIWGNLLDINEIDIHDDFFELGGNSLLAVKLELEMGKINLPIEYSDISNHPTIVALSEYLGDKKQTVTYSDNMAQTNNNIPKADDTAKNTFSSNVAGNMKILENIEPFNEIIYRGCFYSSFFPVVKYYNRPVLLYMINEVNTYTYNKDKIDVVYLPYKPINDISEEHGIHIESKIRSENIIEDITAAISSEKAVIVCIDCYYESIRSDTFMKDHWPHCLLVNGFNEEEKVFYILEHRHSGSLIYEKRTISYKDLANSYNGFVENFKNIDISEIEFRNLKVHKGKEFSTYFEFSTCNNVLNNEYIDNFNIFIAGMLKYRNELNSGLEKIKAYFRQFNSIAKDEILLKERAQLFLDEFNILISAKQAEKYKLDNLNLNHPSIIESLNKSIECLSFVRANIAKFLYSSIYKKNTFEVCIEKLNKACQCESKFYEQLYAFFESKFTKDINLKTNRGLLC